MYALALQARGDAVLTWGQLLRDIPHDASAAIVYLVLGCFVWLIWYGSRPDVIERFGAPPSGVETPPDPREPPSRAEGAEARGADPVEHLEVPMPVRISVTGTGAISPADRGEEPAPLP